MSVPLSRDQGGSGVLTCNRLYGGIAPEITRIEAKDLEIENDDEALLKGGFHYGKNLRSKVYVPPRPLMNHGPHRCKFACM